MGKIRVLFVCTGNICRSPTAEAVLRKVVADDGLSGVIEVDSCGTSAYHLGESPTPAGVESAARRGYDSSSLRARQIETEDFARFDLILAMDRGHLSRLERLSPGPARARLDLFLTYASGGERAGDAADPYYGGADDYETALDLIEPAMPGLLANLKRDFL